MSIEEAARVAIAHFPDTPVETPSGVFSLPVVMVAIAGGESGWRTDAVGDAVDRTQTQRYPACNGYYSWGLWQINIGANLPAVVKLGAPNTPCGAAEWLKVPENNARAAKAIYNSQGLGAWTVWKNQSYLRYLSQAQTAVNQAKAQSGTGAGGTSSFSGIYFGALAEHAALALLGVAAIGIGTVVLWRSGAFEAIRSLISPQRQVGVQVPD